MFFRRSIEFPTLLALTFAFLAACTVPESPAGGKSSHPMARHGSSAAPRVAGDSTVKMPEQIPATQPTTRPAAIATTRPASRPSTQPTTRPAIDEPGDDLLASARSERFVRHVEMARADIEPIVGEGAHGTITFTRTPRGMYLEIEMSGLSPGEHMFHVHEYGDCDSDDLLSAGPHFSPLSLEVGDADKDHALMYLWHLGYLAADRDGAAKLARIEPFRTFEGTNSILGRSVVVHDIDSGPRIACGIIGAVEP